jgi:photosystem II stability/assembly factor-like uncharacterized protein
MKRIRREEQHIKSSLKPSKEDGGMNWRITTDWRVTEVQDVELGIRDASWVAAGTAYGVFMSFDSGSSWKQSSKGLETTFCSALEMDASERQRVWLGTEKGIYYSDNRGENWKKASGFSGAVRTLNQDPENHRIILAGTEDHGILRSEDFGRSWLPSDQGVENLTVYDIDFHPKQPGLVFAGTHGKGVFMSFDNGKTWKKIKRGPDNSVVHSVAVWPGEQSLIVFAGTVNGGIFRWDEESEQWTEAGLGGAQVWELEILRTGAENE